VVEADCIKCKQLEEELTATKALLATVQKVSKELAVKLKESTETTAEQSSMLGSCHQKATSAVDSLSNVYGQKMPQWTYPKQSQDPHPQLMQALQSAQERIEMVKKASNENSVTFAPFISLRRCLGIPEKPHFMRKRAFFVAKPALVFENCLIVQRLAGTSESSESYMRSSPLAEDETAMPAEGETNIVPPVSPSEGKILRRPRTLRRGAIQDMLSNRSLGKHRLTATLHNRDYPAGAEPKTRA